MTVKGCGGSHYNGKMTNVVCLDYIHTKHTSSYYIGYSIHTFLVAFLFKISTYSRKYAILDAASFLKRKKTKTKSGRDLILSIGN